MSLNGNIKVIKDFNHNYSLFFLTKEGELRCETPSSQTVITALLKGENVLGFDLYTDNMAADQIRIAVVTENAEEKYHVYLTDYFDIKKCNCKEFESNAKLWICYPLENLENSFKPNLITIYNSMIAVSVSSKGKDALYYCTDISEKKQPQWQKYTLPENAPLISKILFGTIYKKKGVFLLYDVGNEQTLLFQTLVDQKSGKTFKYRFDVRVNQIYSIEAIYADDGNSSLYAMSKKQVLLFSDPDTKKILMESQDNFAIEDFTASKIVRDLSALSVIESTRNKHYSDDKSNHYILVYNSGLFPEVNFNLFVK